MQGMALIAAWGIGLWVGLFPDPSEAADTPTGEDGEELRGLGDLVPLGDRSLGLVSETVHVTLHGLGFQVAAEYLASNAGPERTVQLGIPTWLDPDALKYTEEARDEARKGAAQVKLVVAGRRYPCALMRGKDAVFRSDPDSPSLRVSVWCAARVLVPSGDAIPVSVEFWGLGATDGRRSEMAYVIGGGGYWRGQIRHVRVDVESDTGGMNLVWPPGGVFAEAGVMRWEGSDVDPKSIGAMVVEFGSSPWTGGWLRAPVRFTAEASSELSPQGGHSYSASNVVDHDPATAWCEGKAGSGVGEWIAVRPQLTAPMAPTAECGVRDIIANPGYGRDDATFSANGRVRVARIEECGSPGSGFDVDMAALSPGGAAGESREVKNARFRLRTPPSWLEHVPACIRMRVERVDSGKHADTCVSEFLPRVFCRSR